MVVEPTLVPYLNGAYAARHGLNRNKVGAHPEKAFAAALKTDAALKKAAQQRLVQITDDVAKRCYVSKIHREVIAAALKQAGA